MTESFSHVSLLGALRRRVEVTATASGTPHGLFELVLREQSPAGAWYSTIVPCTVWGKHLDAARQLAPGSVCLFQGKLARRRTEDGWELCVSGYELQALATPAPACGTRP